MKNLLIFLLISLNHLTLLSQNNLEYSEYLGVNEDTLHHFGEVTIFPQTKISEDFGPRTPHSNGFHGGIDYNSTGTGDDDIKDLIHNVASDTSTIYRDNGAVQNTYSKWITTQGTHNVRYIHIFEAGQITVSEQFNFGGVAVKHINPTNPDDITDEEDWAIIFMQSGTYTAIGPTEGTVTFQDELDSIRTIDVTNSLLESDPIAALGNSRNFVGAGHLHIELLSQLEDDDGNPIYPANDEFAKNPLQIIQHTTPNYCLELLKQNDIDKGVQLAYPGTEITPLQARIRLLEDVNLDCSDSTSYDEPADMCMPTCIKRYNETLNVEYLDFQLKKNNSANWTQLKGQNLSRIIYGGVPGLSVSPEELHDHGYSGAWALRNGVYTGAYNNHPYDDVYLNEFITRMHKNYSDINPEPLFCDCPDDAMYLDGNYKIRARVLDVNLDEHMGEENLFTLDNWKPYIKDVFIFIGGSMIYDEDWTCNNDCVQFSNRNLSTDLTAAQLDNDMEITVSTSEPLTSLSLSIPSLNIQNQALVPSDDSLTWDAIIPSYEFAFLTEEVSLQFSGSDANNNQIISFPSSDSNDCFSIPARSSDTEFVDNNTIDLTFGIDSIHGFGIDCAAIDSLKGGQSSDTRNSSYKTTININSPVITVEETIVHSYCHPECNNGSINIEIDNTEEYDIAWSTGATTFDLANLGAGMYSYTITDDLCGYLESTVAIECSMIEIQYETTPSCNMDGTIEATVFGGTAPYTFVWLDDANETTTSRTALGSNVYTLQVTDSNDCVNSASVFIKNLDPIIMEDMEIAIQNTDCDAENGALEIFTLPSGGLPPFTYELSNGDAGSLQFNNWNAIYHLASGNYIITITDVVGCSGTEEFEIGIDGLPNVNIIQLKHTCEGEANGIIGLSFTDFAINWNTGETGNLITDLAQGTYIYTVTDTDNGCSSVESVDIEVLDANSDPIMTVAEIESNCVGSGADNGKISLTVSGGVPPYSYLWSNGSTSKNILNLSKGDYTVTITDDCGLSSNFSAYVDATEILVNSSWELNFGEISISTNPDGGEAPYSYLWSTNATSEDIQVSEEGTYKVTITDSNGCLIEESIDILLDCEPLEVALKASPGNYDCNTSIIIGFEQAQGNTFLEGTPPFKLLIEEQVDQEWILLESTIINSLGALSQYQYYSSTTGTYKITLVDNCGDTFNEIYEGCLNCNYNFYNGGDDNDKEYVDMFNGMITFEQVCPCDNDCDLFGFTNDKIKLYVDENALENSNLPWNLFNFTIIWPDNEDEKTLIVKSWINDDKKIKILGPTEYVLSDQEFESGIQITVEYNLVQNGNLNLQCKAEIPFEYGKLGWNGEFIATTEGFNIFGPEYEAPYYNGTGVCSTKCETPLITGVLYANQPEGFGPSSVIDCDDDVIVGESNYFRFHPLDWDNPCSGGGFLETHVETDGTISINHVFIESSLALDEAVANIPYLPLDFQNLFCDPNAEFRGYCLFEGLDVYGVEVRNHLVATYCSNAVTLEDTDGDLIPDIYDPCPEFWGIICDNPNDVGTGIDDDHTVGTGTNDAGCITTFYGGTDCTLEIDCEGEETETIVGSIETEIFSGSEPCLHCFSADICKIIDPDTSEEYVDLINVSQGFEITLGDIPECGNVCAIIFTCTLTGEVFWICAADCETSTLPLCNNQEIGNLVSLLGNDEDIESFIREMNEQTTLDIINLNKENDSSSLIDIYTIPNPSQKDHEFNVHINASRNFSSTLSILNIYGQLILKKEIEIKKGENKFKFENALLPGVYFIKTIDNQKIITTKHAVHD